MGATGVEPARIAPKDPKSFASANSATRPDSLSIFAAVAGTVNTFRWLAATAMGWPYDSKRAASQPMRCAFAMAEKVMVVAGMLGKTVASTA